MPERPPPRPVEPVRRRIEPAPPPPPPLALPPLEKPEIVEVGEVPTGWDALCERREAAVEALLELASGKNPPKGKAAHKRLRPLICELRLSSCALVEALIDWQEDVERNQRVQVHRRAWPGRGVSVVGGRRVVGQRRGGGLAGVERVLVAAGEVGARMRLGCA